MSKNILWQYFSHLFDSSIDPHILEQQALDIISQLLFITIILCLLWYTLKFLSKSLQNFQQQYNIEPTLAKGIEHLISLTIYTISIIFIFENLNIEISNVLKTLGVLAVGLSVAGQQMIAGAICGIFLLTYKSFSLGDEISCESPKFQGKVIDINLQNTILDQQGDRVIIPNQTLYNATITVKKQTIADKK